MLADSEMALAVIEDTIQRHGIAPPCIYDSFLVPERLENDTWEAMEKAYPIGLEIAREMAA